MNKEEIIELLKKKFKSWSEIDYDKTVDFILKMELSENQIINLIKKSGSHEEMYFYINNPRKTISLETSSSEGFIDSVKDVLTYTFEGWNNDLKYSIAQQLHKSVRKGNKDLHMELQYVHDFTLNLYETDLKLFNELSNSEIEQQKRFELFFEYYKKVRSKKVESEIETPLKKGIDKKIPDEAYNLLKGILLPKQLRLIEILWSAIQNPDLEISEEQKKRGTDRLKKIMKYVKDTFPSANNITEILKRIKERLKPHRNQLTSLLEFNTSSKDQEYLLQILDILDFIKKQEPLKAYRLSEIETESIYDLLGLFGWRSFHDSDYELPQRLPEIYYDTRKNIERFYNLPKATESTPDYFGVYLYDIVSDSTNEPIRATTEEGIIILFKDRIESGEKTLEEIDALRYIVLMHELGHWISHMATYNGKDKCFESTEWKNWELGYNYLPSPSKIKETFAQLFAYWKEKHLKN